MQESSTSMGELIGGILVLSTIAALVLSVRTPEARVPAGLLLLGFAVAFGAVGAWRLVEGDEVEVVRWLLFVACTSIGGVLLFQWGRRTTP